MVSNRGMGWIISMLFLATYAAVFAFSQAGILPADAWITLTNVAAVYIGIAALLLTVKYFRERQLMQSILFLLLFIGLTVSGWSSIFQ